MRNLENKVAIITGGSDGIGREIAKKFLTMGSQVIICGRGEEKGKKCIEDLSKFGEHIKFIKCDVKKSKEVESLMNNAVGYFGRIDFLVNNAGIGGYSMPMIEYPEDIWEKVLNINLKGSFLCMKYAIREILKHRTGGSIVNLSSIAGLVGADWNVAPYAASKHAVIGLTKSAALEFANKNIRVNAICPAFTQTEMLEGLFKASGDEEKARTDLANKHPMKRLGLPEEVANVAVWLCSDEASFITGTAIPVDGGYTAR